MKLTVREQRLMDRIAAWMKRSEKIDFFIGDKR
jgi:hypothetical protein